MLYLCYVLEFVIDGFYNCSLSEEQFVRHTHQRPFHIAFQLSDELYPIYKESLEEILSYVAFVPNEFAIYEINKCLVFQRFSVIHISGSYHKVE